VGEKQYRYFLKKHKTGKRLTPKAGGSFQKKWAKAEYKMNGKVIRSRGLKPEKNSKKEKVKKDMSLDWATANGGSPDLSFNSQKNGDTLKWRWGNTGQKGRDGVLIWAPTGGGKGCARKCTTKQKRGRKGEV